MAKISVLTPTIRPEGLKLVEIALKRQTFQDFEWVIGAPFYPGNDLKWDMYVPDEFEGGLWTLNRIYNKMIRMSGGELIVSLQDFTMIDPDGLERLWGHYKADSGTVVGGVGNKYDKVYPELGKLLWEDPRKHTGHTDFPWIEFNFCSISRRIITSIGGFDEEMDFKFFGMDGYNVLQRLNEWECKFFLDTGIRSYSLEHGRVKDWEKNNGLHGAYKKHIEKRKAGKEWPALSYLG